MTVRELSLFSCPRYASFSIYEEYFDAVSLSRTVSPAPLAVFVDIDISFHNIAD